MKQSQIDDKEATHFKECTELSKKLKTKYKGHIDCGITEALCKFPGTDRAETAIYDSMNILACIVKAYSEEPSIKERLDQELERNNIFSRRVSATDRLNSIEVFFYDLFNFHTPGYIDMHRLLSDPEIFLKDDLKYLSDVFLDDSVEQSCKMKYKSAEMKAKYLDRVYDLEAKKSTDE